MSARILIIDDADHLRTVLKLTLEFKGYTVTTAADGRAGLEAARATLFDLIFCDIEMPVMNGVEFVQHYRAEVDATTPIIMLTAEANDLVSRALAAGGTAYIAKPFEPIRLLQEIDKHMS